MTLFFFQKQGRPPFSNDHPADAGVVFLVTYFFISPFERSNNGFRRSVNDYPFTGASSSSRLLCAGIVRVQELDSCAETDQFCRPSDFFDKMLPPCKGCWVHDSRREFSKEFSRDAHGGKVIWRNDKCCKYCERGAACRYDFIARR
jgi:hypothetical protein